MRKRTVVQSADLVAADTHIGWHLPKDRLGKILGSVQDTIRCRHNLVIDNLSGWLVASYFSGSISSS